jgi:hypothetical protein
VLLATSLPENPRNGPTAKFGADPAPVCSCATVSSATVGRFVAALIRTSAMVAAVCADPRYALNPTLTVSR